MRETAAGKSYLPRRGRSRNNRAFSHVQGDLSRGLIPMYSQSNKMLAITMSSAMMTTSVLQKRNIVRAHCLDGEITDTGIAEYGFDNYGCARQPRESFPNW